MEAALVGFIRTGDKAVCLSGSQRQGSPKVRARRRPCAVSGVMTTASRTLAEPEPGLQACRDRARARSRRLTLKTVELNVVPAATRSMGGGETGRFDLLQHMPGFASVLAGPNHIYDM